MTDTYTPVLTEEQILYHGPGQADAQWAYEDQVYFARAIERAAIEAYQRQQWRPIETAPRDGTRIIVYRKPEPGYGRTIIGVDVWHRDSWWHSRRAMQPIAWMPLPLPPAPTEGTT